MAKDWVLRPINQQKCFDKAITKSKFLIAAKCRFGKTFVASEIAFVGWKAKQNNKRVLVVAGFSNVRDEWENTIKNQFEDCKDIFEFQTIQYLKVGNERGSIIKRNKGCYLIFDEAHFGERTCKTQEIIQELNPSKILYLTATPYTDSLITSFAKENGLEGDNQFSYSIQDEFEDYFKDKVNFVKENKYIPVSVSLSILQYSELCEEKPIWTILAWNRFKNELDSKGYKTFMYFVKNRKEADSVRKAFEKFPELRGHVHQLSGTENEKDSENFDEKLTRSYFEDVNKAKEEIYQAHQKGEYFAVIACKRGGTGVTWKGLDCICFYNAPDSAIDFIQKGYRCASPEDNKTQATVYCFNKESALNVYLKVNEKEAIRKGKDPSENLEEFKKFFKLEGEFTNYDFGTLIQELGKRFSWRLFDVSGIDLDLFKDDGSFVLNSSKNTKKSTNNQNKDLDSNKRETKERNQAKSKKEDDKSEENLETKKQAIFTIFVKMYTELEFLQFVHNFDVLKTNTYKDWVWEKVSKKFTKDQWENLLSNNGRAIAKMIENQVKEQEEYNLRKKINVEKERAKKKEDLKEKYEDSFTKTVKEVESRKTGLQKDLKDLSLTYNGLIYGKYEVDSEYAHITPYSDVKCTDDSFDFENGILIPSFLHHCWDRGDIDFEIVENDYLKIKVINKTDATDGIRDLGISLSNKALSAGQKSFFLKRGTK